MKKITKALSLTLAAAISMSAAVSLAACGVEERDPNTILFEYLSAGFGDEPYMAVAKAFEEKNPGKKVKLVPNREIVGTAANSISTGTGVSDIYSYPYGNVLKTWYTNGWLEDLSDVCAQQTQDGRTMLESMTGNAAKSLGIKGGIYGIPEYTSVTGLVYNVDLFEEYGWEIPNTTKEFEALCNQIDADTNGAVTPLVWCKDAEGYLYFATENWISQREGIANMDKFHAYESAEVYATQDNDQGSLYTSKKMALNNLQKFFLPKKEGGYAHDNSRTMSNTKAQEAVIKKECAMMLNGSWFVNEMALYLQANPTTLGIFALPEMTDAMGNVTHAPGYATENDKRVLTADYGAYYFIPSNAPNKELAKEFLLFLSSEEACSLYTQYANAVRPFIYDVSETSDLYSKVSDFGKSVLKMADQHYLYAAISSSELALKGKGGLWPRGNRVESEMMANAQGNADDLLREDYTFATQNWDSWMALLK